MKRSNLVCVVAMAAGVMAAHGAQAQSGFPSKQITVMVGFAPGGGTDTAARIVAKRLTATLGQSVVVENIPGAGGNIAHETLAKANPDGHTILLGSVGSLAVAPHIVSKLPYNPLRDFAPLTMAVTFPNVLVVNNSVPAKTLGEFVKMAGVKPGAVNFGSSGIGGAGHLAGELLNMMANVKMTHVPYKGGAPAMSDLLGGQIMSIFATPVTGGPHVRAGKIRALVVTGKVRSPAMPEVPTVAESGYPDYEALNWYCYLAPGKTPRDIVQRWTKELVAVLSESDTQGQLQKHGMEPAPGSGEALQKYIEREYAVWGKVVKAAGITAN
ncbi:MAG: Twin-arginine translocation pathway signal [Betaproteobacteria bacterium RIFCSPLOWO2_02_FULL_62_17]|nr:MAG: Twin-arginine translocation pathway signal [Betaproteobacteria bacterium RIFCSPLOWO2_02_FULL_62_17]